MTVGSNGAVGAMPMFRLLDFDRDETDLAVLNAAFGDYALRKGLHRGAFAPEYGDLKAIFVIQMDMHRRDRKIVIVMVCPA